MNRIRLLYWVDNILFESFVEVCISNKEKALNHAKEMFNNCDCYLAK